MKSICYFPVICKCYENGKSIKVNEKYKKNALCRSPAIRETGDISKDISSKLGGRLMYAGSGMLFFL